MNILSGSHRANAWLYDFMVETGTMANPAETTGTRAFAVCAETGTPKDPCYLS